MSKFLTKLENDYYPFSKEIFNKILNSYMHPERVCNNELELVGVLSHVGLDNYIYRSLIYFDNYKSPNEIANRDKYIDKLILNRTKGCISGGWIYVNGKDNNKYKEKMGDIKHRLYISPQREDLYEFSSKLFDKFNQDGINYYFKIIDCLGRSKKRHRRDAIVIYSDDDNLDDTVKSLIEFSNENEYLIMRCNNPSIITRSFSNKKGNVWLGYAKEDSSKVDTSYTQEFSMCFRNAIEKLCLDYLKHSNKTIKFKDTDKYGIIFGGKYNYKTFQSHADYDLRLYLLSNFILTKSKTSKDILYKYVKNELCLNNFDLNNFPVQNNKNEKGKIKIKKPNE